MRNTDRREFLGMALLALAAPAVRAEGPEPAAPGKAEWEAIRWGRTVSGLQAGLRVAHPRASYKIGDQIGLAAYLRNRTSKPIRFTYWHAFHEKTPTVLGPDSKEIRVAGYTDLAAVQTATLVTIPAKETLVVNHPGLWLTTDRPEGSQYPGLPEPAAGVYHISQNIPFGLNPRDAYHVQSQPVVLFSDTHNFHRAEAYIVPTSKDNTPLNVTSGVVEVTVTGRGG